MALGNLLDEEDAIMTDTSIAPTSDVAAMYERLKEDADDLQQGRLRLSSMAIVKQYHDAAAMLARIAKERDELRALDVATVERINAFVEALRDAEARATEDATKLAVKLDAANTLVEQLSAANIRLDANLARTAKERDSLANDVKRVKAVIAVIFDQTADGLLFERNMLLRSKKLWDQSLSRK